MSSLTLVRLAIMARFAELADVTVPQDPLPFTIPDKSILIFPRMGPSTKLGMGKDRSLAYTETKSLDIEYHRRIAYKDLGSVIADVTEKIVLITQTSWGEFAGGGGKFDGTVESMESVSLMHFGSLDWNEWTFGARMEISVTFNNEVRP